MEVLQTRAVQLPYRASFLSSMHSNFSHVKLLVHRTPSPALLLTKTPTQVLLHIPTPAQTNISPSPSTPTPASTHSEVPTSPIPTPTPMSMPTPARAPDHRRKLHPWLIVGIGNPGNKFHKTRHNVGFEMIDAIAEAEGIKLNTIQQKALTGKGEIGPTQVLLAKPQTYVNLTGQSVGPLAAYYRIPVQQILVIFDDMDLEFGLMRLGTKGGHGSSNGLKSVIENLKGCRLFPRLRIGIGKPPGTMDPGAFVLQRFSEEEREEIDELLLQGPVLVREMITEGIEKTAEAWNELRKSRMQLTTDELQILKQLSCNSNF